MLEFWLDLIRLKQSLGSEIRTAVKFSFGKIVFHLLYIHQANSSIVLCSPELKLKTKVGEAAAAAGGQILESLVTSASVPKTQNWSIFCFCLKQLTPIHQKRNLSLLGWDMGVCDLLRNTLRYPNPSLLETGHLVLVALVIVLVINL